jgi:hypothetical protein
MLGPEHSSRHVSSAVLDCSAGFQPALLSQLCSAATGSRGIRRSKEVKDKARKLARHKRLAGAQHAVPALLPLKTRQQEVSRQRAPRQILPAGRPPMTSYSQLPIRPASPSRSEPCKRGNPPADDRRLAAHNRAMLAGSYSQNAGSRSRAKRPRIHDIRITTHKTSNCFASRRGLSVLPCFFAAAGLLGSSAS